MMSLLGDWPMVTKATRLVIRYIPNQPTIQAKFVRAILPLGALVPTAKLPEEKLPCFA
jgi:hypothetical protein